MGNRTLNPNATSYGGPNIVYAEFEMLGNGAAALTNSTDAALIVTSNVRSAAGTFVFTLKDPYTKVVYKSADIDDTLIDGSYASCGNVINESTGQPIQFTLYTRNAAGALADPAVGRRVCVSIRFRNGLGGGVK